MSDQYIGGLLLEKVKNNFKVKHVWTDAVQGPHVGKSSLDEQLMGIEFKDDESIIWLVSEEGIYNGIYWSLRQLA